MNKIVSALLVVVVIGAVVWSFAFGVPMYMVWQQQKAGVPITESFRLKEGK